MSRTAGREREGVFDAFRRLGYLAANLDPLGFFPSLALPDLELEGETADQARKLYCGTIGAEFTHIFVKRSASASSATGSAKAHELEQRALIALAYTTGP